MKFLKSLFLFLFTSIFFSCSNFYESSLLKKKIDDTLRRENAPFVKGRIEKQNKDDSSSLSPEGDIMNQKIGYPFSVSYIGNSDYYFVDWQAYDEDYKLCSDSEVSFENKYSTTTLVTVNTPSKVYIQAQTTKKIRLESIKPEFTLSGESYNNNIELKFTGPVDRNSFYFTETEISNINPDITFSINDEIYGYKKDGKTVFKNIRILSEDIDLLENNHFFGPIFMENDSKIIFKYNYDKPFKPENSSYKDISILLGDGIYSKNQFLCEINNKNYEYRINKSTLEILKPLISSFYITNDLKNKWDGESISDKNFSLWKENDLLKNYGDMFFGKFNIVTQATRIQNAKVYLKEVNEYSLEKEYISENNQPSFISITNIIKTSTSDNSFDVYLRLNNKNSNLDGLYSVQFSFIDNSGCESERTEKRYLYFLNSSNSYENLSYRIHSDERLLANVFETENKNLLRQKIKITLPTDISLEKKKLIINESSFSIKGQLYFEYCLNGDDLIRSADILNKFDYNEDENYITLKKGTVYLDLTDFEGFSSYFNNENINQPFSIGLFYSYSTNSYPEIRIPSQPHYKVFYFNHNNKMSFYIPNLQNLEDFMETYIKDSNGNISFLQNNMLFENLNFYMSDMDYDENSLSSIKIIAISKENGIYGAFDYCDLSPLDNSIVFEQDIPPLKYKLIPTGGPSSNLCDVEFLIPKITKKDVIFTLQINWDNEIVTEPNSISSESPVNEDGFHIMKLKNVNAENPFSFVYGTLTGKNNSYQKYYFNHPNLSDQPDNVAPKVSCSERWIIRSRSYGITFSDNHLFGKNELTKDFKYYVSDIPSLTLDDLNELNLWKNGTIKRSFSEYTKDGNGILDKKYFSSGKNYVYVYVEDSALEYNPDQYKFNNPLFTAVEVDFSDYKETVFKSYKLEKTGKGIEISNKDGFNVTDIDLVTDNGYKNLFSGSNSIVVKEDYSFYRINQDPSRGEHIPDYFCTKKAVLPLCNLIDGKSGISILKSDSGEYENIPVLIQTYYSYFNLEQQLDKWMLLGLETDPQLIYKSQNISEKGIPVGAYYVIVARFPDNETVLISDVHLKNK